MNFSCANPDCNAEWQHTQHHLYGGGKSISFSATVKLPTSRTAPYPAVIGYVGGSIPISTNVVLITYNNQDIAVDNPHGQGRFYGLYGLANDAGGLIAWAWGASRIIDALELVGSAASKIDVGRIGVTGCSRNGKGALIAEAFNERMKFAIAQEGGSGGPDIVKEDGWFRPSFAQLTGEVDLLPYDHNMLEALVAPRGLLIIENSGIDYLGPQPELMAFTNKFLLGQNDVATDVFKTDEKFNFT
ncbi:uncharacterized protein PAC_12040 [Phialocephala subalpina]|uniref:(4-O-methyl)-D-glucuronate--lignin esterase n=1 Tax=Phialocephala subalpina TaxID=576137 RepID=A0A1L7XAT8_9HELO|nr:uncharacterized protein PAC_12040 [Phialocephala subalpina]